jgi:hypothetical protein
MIRLSRLIPAILIGFFPTSSFAQTTQTVVSEHFTNTRCSFCASRNPGYFNNLSQQDNVIHISYHPSRPYSSCVLNQHNVSGNDDRTKFYGIYGGTPRIVINGQVVSASTNYGDTGIFTSHLRKTTEWSIASGGEIIDGKLVINTEVERLGSSTESLELITQVVEDTVFYSAPNGEDQHYNVFRVNGQSHAVVFQSGESVLRFSDTVDVDGEWDNSRVKLISMLQRNDQTMAQAYESAIVEDNGQTASVRTKPAAPFFTYPNPATGLLNIEWVNSNDTRYIVRDVRGNNLISGSGKRVNVSNLPQGVYFIEVSDEHLIRRARVVVK